MLARSSFVHAVGLLRLRNVIIAAVSASLLYASVQSKMQGGLFVLLMMRHWRAFTWLSAAKLKASWNRTKLPLGASAHAVRIGWGMQDGRVQSTMSSLLDKRWGCCSMVSWNPYIFNNSKVVTRRANHVPDLSWKGVPNLWPKKLL